MPSRHPRRRFQDILDNIEKICSYTAGYDETRFESDDQVMDAVERCLARISEAAIKLDALAEELAPDVPWRDIRGLGNNLRHAYEAVSPRTIWQIVTEHLSPLATACTKALDALPANDD